MKKTILSLLILASVASSAEQTTWDLQIFKDATTTTGSDSINSENANFKFDSTTPLTTYVFDFKLDDIADYTGTDYTFTLFSTYRGDDGGGSWREGIGLGAEELPADTLTCYIYKGEATTKSNGDPTTNYTKLTDTDSITINENDIVRFAYDSVTATVLVYNMTTNKWLQATTTENDEKYYFKSGTAQKNAGSSAVYTQGGNHDMTFGYVTDLKALAGDVSAIKQYMQYAPLPEPTTATLSLLALAGLAARRRRRK